MILYWNNALLIIIIIIFGGGACEDFVCLETNLSCKIHEEFLLETFSKFKHKTDTRGDLSLLFQFILS